MKQNIQTLFETGVQAANPALAVRKELAHAPLAPNPSGRLIIIAIGKAATAMIQEALAHVPLGQSTEAIAVTNYENARDVTGCTVIAAGHPLPDENGLRAGTQIVELLQSSTVHDQVLCLISGGGSALLPTPRDGLSLSDKIAVNDVLLGAGLDIVKMNAIRQQLSRLKGGGLTALAHPSPVRSLIVSDVVGDDLRAIASGPTASPIGGISAIVSELKALGEWRKLPQTAQTLIQTPRDVALRDAENTLICSNQHSLNAIALAGRELQPHIMNDPLVGDVNQAAQTVIADARKHLKGNCQLLIWGGETTVKLAGDGLGGRNQELALRVAELGEQIGGEWQFLSGGTDGRDGPTDAAGGIVDRSTLSHANTNGLDVPAALQNNDSYHMLKQLDALLMTGATGTNVADIQLLLRIA